MSQTLANKLPKKLGTKLNIAIIGASGYTGAECYSLLLNHPFVDSIELVANANAGKDISEIYNTFYKNPCKIKKLEEVNFTKLDAAFFCLPHGQSQQIIIDIYNKNKHLKIFDLSADFRFNNTNLYEQVYNAKHIAKDIQASDVCYGLCEIVSQDKIKSSRIIACPGCYPTSAILPLYPLIQNGIVNRSSNIIIDSKSAISGAGRKESAQYLFNERSDNIMAYSIFNHRHRYEIAEKLDIESSNILFTPHLVPMLRGIESTIYAKLTKDFSIEDIKNKVKNFYKDCEFVKVVDFIPSTAIVKATNNVAMYFALENNNLIISSVVDNICKGSSGAAVQCFNISFGLEESLGLNTLRSFV